MLTLFQALVSVGQSNAATRLLDGVMGSRMVSGSGSGHGKGQEQEEDQGLAHGHFDTSSATSSDLPRLLVALPARSLRHVRVYVCICASSGLSLRLPTPLRASLARCYCVCTTPLSILHPPMPPNTRRCIGHSSPASTAVRIAVRVARRRSPLRLIS